MKLTHVTSSNHTVVTLEGELNSHSLTLHRDALNKIVERSKQGVVLDLQKVTALDSSGVGAMIFWFKRLRSRRLCFAVIGLNGQPLKLARLLRLDHTLRMYDSLADWTGQCSEDALTDIPGLQSC